MQRVEELDDKTYTDHFENIQSTNWQNMRWKPPPANKNNPNHIGWRVEFRTMEVYWLPLPSPPPVPGLDGSFFDLRALSVSGPPPVCPHESLRC